MIVLRAEFDMEGRSERIYPANLASSVRDGGVK